jgi:hypothetical protein
MKDGHGQFGRDYDDVGSHGILGAHRSGSTLQPASGYQPFTPPRTRSCRRSA